MSLKILLIITIMGCCFVKFYSGENVMWRQVYVSLSELTSETMISASSDVVCAIKATQLKWPWLLRYEDGSCYISTLMKIPTKDSPADPNQLACKTRIPPTQKPCLPPFTLLADGLGCYKIVTTKATYKDAKETCLGMGGDLASPGLVQNNTLYANVVKQLGFMELVYMWLGVTRDDTQGIFLQDSTSGKPPLPEEFWTKDEPENTEGCAVLFHFNNLLGDVPCTQDNHYSLCEISGFKF